MKRWNTLLVGILAVTGSMGQAPNWQWVKGAASDYNENANDVCYDNSSGSVYIAGATEGGLQNIYGALFTNVLGSKDGFVAKYTSAGDLIWAFQLGGAGVDEIKSIATSPSGEVYVLGIFQSTMDFDPGIGISNLVATGLSQDGFLAKYSSAGNFLWAVKFGGASTEESYKVYVDANGVYICGSYIGSSSFSSTDITVKSTAATQGQANFFGAKYNHSGVVQWVVSGGSTKNDLALDVVADNSRVYFTGSYERNFTLYNGSGTAVTTVQTISPDKYDVFTAAFNQNGTFSWATNAASLDIDEGHAITQDQSNIYISGCHKNNPVYFRYPNPQFTKQSSGNYDIFVASISKSTGDYQWVSGHTGSGNANEEPYEMDIDQNGNLVITGFFLGSLDYSPFGGPVLNNTGGSDLFLLSLSSSGNFLWAKRAGGDKTDVPHGISIAPNGEIYIAGVYSGDSSFGGITLDNEEQDNVFVAKTGCNVLSNNVIPVSQTVCVSSPPQIIGSSPQGDPGNSYNFLWQQSEDNVSWIAAAGTNTVQDYTPPFLYSDTYYRRIASSENVCNGSVVSNTMFVKTHPPTPAAQAGADKSTCTPSILVSGNMQGIVTGTWSVIQGSASIASPNTFSTIVNIFSSGATLRWKIKSGLCPASYDDVVITKIPFPNAYAGQDETVSTDSVQLAANISQGVTGNWAVVSGPATIDSPGSPVTIARNLGEGENVFRWKLNNNVCESSDDVIVLYRNDKPVVKEVFEIPNGFTPNEDGYNDAFIIKGLEKFSSAKLQIFNRWGSRIYEDANYKNTWKATNMSNEKVVDDTYFYTLEIPQKGNYSGFIVVKRN